MTELTLAADTSTPSLTDWLQGVGTLLAVIVSFVALTLELLRRRREAEEAKRRQASRVLAWLSQNFVGTTGEGGMVWQTESLTDAVVRNLGEEPVWDLRAYVLSNAGDRMASAEAPMLLPGSDWKFSRRLPIDPPTTDEDTHTAPHVPGHVRVFFTDIDGMRWQREKATYRRA